MSLNFHHSNIASSSPVSSLQGFSLSSSSSSSFSSSSSDCVSSSRLALTSSITSSLSLRRLRHNGVRGSALCRIVVVLSFLFPVLLFFFVSTASGDAMTSSAGRKCQRITIPMCRGVGYNLTYTPNQFLHDTQAEAGLQVHQFWPLVEIRCSADLRLFLCSLYAPICVPDYPRPLPACRPVCERAKTGCSPLMLRYGFRWPERMDCDGLPASGDPDRPCMEWEDTSSPTTDVTSMTSPQDSSSSSVSEIDCRCMCRTPFVEIRNNSGGGAWFDRIRTPGNQWNCAASCRWTPRSDLFTEFWIGLWAVLCLLSSAATILTFLIEPARFLYPERSIAYISLSYAVVAIGYVIRLVLGHDVIACERYQGDQMILRRHDSLMSHRPAASCCVVFLLVYTFGMTANTWWVVLSVTWFLSAGLKWGREAIEAHSVRFHLGAWLLPVAQAVAAMSTSGVDGDVISGVCYVGTGSDWNRRLFVIGPLCFYLAVGTAFLIAGFASVTRFRGLIRNDGSGTRKLERFVLRMGVYSLLHVVPAAALIVCHVYEDRVKSRQQVAVNCRCQGQGHGQGQYDDDIYRSYFALFVAKYFSSLVFGIASGFWVWTGKTVESWIRFCRRHSPSSSTGGVAGRPETTRDFGAGTVAIEEGLAAGRHLPAQPSKTSRDRMSHSKSAD